MTRAAGSCLAIAIVSSVGTRFVDPLRRWVDGHSQGVQSEAALLAPLLWPAVVILAGAAVGRALRWPGSGASAPFLGWFVGGGLTLHALGLPWLWWEAGCSGTVSPWEGAWVAMGAIGAGLAGADRGAAPGVRRTGARKAIRLAALPVGLYSVGLLTLWLVGAVWTVVR